MAKIMIVGSGVVGQATGKGLISKGHEVVFVDTNLEIIWMLSQEGLEARLPNELDDVCADISMFCVSTPSREDGSVNLDNITAAITNHGKWLKYQKGWHLVVIRSTVPQVLPEGYCSHCLKKFPAW